MMLKQECQDAYFVLWATLLAAQREAKKRLGEDSRLMTPLDLAITQRTYAGMEGIHVVDDSGISNVDIFNLFSRNLLMPGASLQRIRQLFTPLTEMDEAVINMFNRRLLTAST
jgi:hypothetical protein